MVRLMGSDYRSLWMSVAPGDLAFFPYQKNTTLLTSNATS